MVLWLERHLGIITVRRILPRGVRPTTGPLALRASTVCVTRHAPGPWSLTWHQYGAYWCYEGEDWKQDSPAEREPSGKNGSAGPYFSQDPAGKLEPYACRTYLERNRGRETKARANL